MIANIKLTGDQKRKLRPCFEALQNKGMILAQIFEEEDAAVYVVPPALAKQLYDLFIANFESEEKYYERI